MGDDWVPLTDAHVVDALDRAEVSEGYRDGMGNDPRPGANRSEAYRHGWWKGMYDGHHREPHPADFELIRNMRAARLGPFSPEFGAALREVFAPAAPVED